jgi:hypothetical protein
LKEKKMARSNIGKDISDQFTAARRVVTILAKFTPAQRERIMGIVGEHVFEDAPKVPDERQVEVAFS